MKSIKAEGVSFKYIFANEVIDEKDTPFNSNDFLRGRNVPLNIYKELQDGVNTRLAIFKRLLLQKDSESRRMWCDMPYCLVWTNEQIDLNVLDQKVMDNCFSDEDFYDSIRTQIIQLICFNCRNEYITLVADRADIYIAVDENGKPDQFQSNLLKKKFSNLKSELCPNCNHPFTMPAIKILYQHTEDC